MRSRKRLVALLLAAGSGALLAAANEPFGLGPLGWVALVPLFVACLSGRRARDGALAGLLCGGVFFGVHLSWIFIFGWIAYVPLVVVMSLYFAVAGGLATFFRRFPLAPVLVAGAWTGAELLRDFWPFGGFPWGALGVTQGSVPGVRSLASAIGVYGLGFVLAFSSALIADALTRRVLAWPSLAVVAAAVALFVGVDVARYRPREAGSPFTVGVVQGSVPRPVTVEQDERVFESHVRLTRELAERGELPDVVIWPESAIGTGIDGDRAREVLEIARGLERPILVGQAVAQPEDTTFRNLVHHVAPDGRVAATYEKRHPVPFGERVPIPFLRRYVSTLGQVPYDMQSGSEAVVFDVNGTRVGSPICFESVFPRDVRAFARNGAEVVVVSTNDSSFERSYASTQHLANSRMRALETRQWVVQAALSGISAVVAPDGAISHRTELFEREVVVAEVLARPAGSLYVRVGDLFSYAWAAGTALAASTWIAILVFGRRRAGESSEADVEPEPSRAPLA